MEEALFRVLESRYYAHQVPVLALDYYDPHSQGEDEFSRKQVWFSTYGDQEIHEEFREGLSQLVRERFVGDSADWDFMTLYPLHARDKLNPHMRDLMMDVAAGTGMSIEQVIRRTETIKESHELDSMKSKLINLEGSLEVRPGVEGKNIILVDNITLTGASLIHGANRLKQNGASTVFGVCLGTSIDAIENTIDAENLTASQLMARRGIQGEGDFSE